jgi:hypothetical protein
MMAEQEKKPEAEHAAKPAEQSPKQGRAGKPAPTPDAMFRKHRVLPDAKTIFSHAIPRLADVKDDCIVVPDASVLLAPYQEIGKATLNEIKATYQKLIQQERFIIPGQVAREFAANRPRLIGEVINTLSKFAGTLNLQCGNEKPELPILQHAAENEAFNQAWFDAAKSLGELRESFAKVVDAVKSWALNDPISLLYRELFKPELILDLPADEHKLPAELRKRFDHKIPPGYIDEGKEDGGVGDYLVWLTILEIGRTRKQSVLFVTGEKKADWVHGSIEGPFSPRYELLEEFRQASGGQGFYAAPLHVALQLFGVSDQESIEQVKRSERLRFAEPRWERVYANTRLRLLIVDLKYGREEWMMHANRGDREEACTVLRKMLIQCKDARNFLPDNDQTAAIDMSLEALSNTVIENISISTFSLLGPHVRRHIDAIIDNFEAFCESLGE